MNTWSLVDSPVLDLGAVGLQRKYVTGSGYFLLVVLNVSLLLPVSVTVPLVCHHGIQPCGTIRLQNHFVL